MLFAFILFGAVLSTLVGTVPLAATLALAAITLFVARPAAVAIVLRRAGGLAAAPARSSRGSARAGSPRCCSRSSPCRPGLPGAEMILAIAGVVVTVSVVLHGITATPLAALVRAPRCVARRWRKSG